MTTPVPTPSIDELADRYIAVEKRVHGIVSRFSGVICTQCKDPCCTSKHCSDIGESIWLQLVAQRDGNVLVPRQDGSYCFLGDTGCTLTAGRPMQCTWYICDTLCLEICEPLEHFLYQVVSSVLVYIIRNISRGTDLLDIEALDELTPVRLRKLDRRLHEAHEMLDIVEALRANPAQSMPLSEAAIPLLKLARWFPFTAGRVRFAGEAPSLSAAGRKQQAVQAGA
jgi:hypothetical protein